ncbi:MAG: hypothetical protein JWR38_1967 [Mucilaginibacter sp.]|nr:hypothetical protein [Mucilaginibacter sp.]
MTEAEQYNLLWLANAMTLPISHTDEHYYYDDSRKELFYTIKAKGNSFGIGILNKFDLQYSKEIESDLAVRLELIGNESSEIVEVPRINVAEKIDIQLEFLSKLPGTFHHNELIRAVEHQRDDYKFVLDSALIENDNSAPMAIYWDDYKLQIIYTFITNFYTLIGIKLNP